MIEENLARYRGTIRTNAGVAQDLWLFADYWLQVTDPGDPRATRLNALPKYVVSTTLDRVQWNNTVSAALIRTRVVRDSVSRQASGRTASLRKAGRRPLLGLSPVGLLPLGGTPCRFVALPLAHAFCTAASYLAAPAE